MLSSNFVARQKHNETANKYGVTTLSQNGMVSKHIYPYYNSHGKHVANKLEHYQKSLLLKETLENLNSLVKTYLVVDKSTLQLE